ncbi:MAG: cob(I)yrinic acid a,c-diamide adenosyltransferase [Chromatiaceae bacterium]|nr:MAG: cob(I)yrinic acid a,c-diamide adenosyltransferase [Chromatiaceae bacterium]
MTTTDPAAEARHRRRMQRHKDLVDARIASATDERGVLLVLTGNGKGKSSSAFGMAARALGHGLRVAIVQFIKGSFATGEEAFFRRFPEVTYHVMGDGYTWDTQDREQDQRTAARAWEQVQVHLQDPSVDLLILDELNLVLKLRLLSLDRVLDALIARPLGQHVVVTGRAAPPELIEIADTVTEMRPVKHAFDAGIKAQKGIEL